MKQKLKSWLKHAASNAPKSLQQELKRLHFRRQISRGVFVTNELEFNRLREWVHEGDWVLDVGANIGHYTLRLSQLVGPSGRVFAFEPMADTFELLAANVARSHAGNVTLMNVAASESVGRAGMSLPVFDSGLDNYYMAGITGGEGPINVVTMPIDFLQLPHRVSFVKIDVEGHELQAIRGMINLLKRDRPVLVVEGFSTEVADILSVAGYMFSDLPKSSNRIYHIEGLQRPVPAVRP